jgi:sigma-B regulation protein RsbU (phosphoserine phosphatase)
VRLIVLLALCVSTAFGQEPVWRVMAGDDPAYARPEFDDSGWAVDSWQVSSLLGNGARWRGGVQWYRATFVVPDERRGKPLAVGAGPLKHAYDVFAEGVQIGKFGEWTPRQVLWVPRHETFSIPTELTQSGQVHIAIRRFTRPESTSWTVFQTAGGVGYPHQPQVGLFPEIKATEELHRAAGAMAMMPQNLIVLVLAACGVVCLVFFAIQRRERQYLWVGLYMTSGAVATLGAELMGIAYWFPVYGVVGIAVPFLKHGAYWGICFLAELVRGTRHASRAFFIAAFAYGAAFVTGLWLSRGEFPIFLFLVPSLTASFLLCAVSATAICLWRGSREAVLLCGSVGVGALGPVINQFRLLRLNFQLGDVRFFSSFIIVGAVQVDLSNLAPAATAIVMTFILWRRFRLEQRRLLSMELDLEAARNVQQLMVAGEGVGVEAVYKPAAEVGGDFYQVLDLEGGARLIAVGDVSGKGLRAAMVVSMVVGLVRRDRNLSPGALLAAVNRELLGTMKGGFVTCLVVRQEADGRMVMANAGHPAPYASGVEVEVEPGLPLGIAQTDYAETTGRFESLMLLSDGVVEAARADGELFGFERTREISGLSAAEIAEAARAWGQNDDITVVTVRRAA